MSTNSKINYDLFNAGVTFMETTPPPPHYAYIGSLVCTRLHITSSTLWQQEPHSGHSALPFW
jgi:hypothetical protein